MTLWEGLKTQLHWTKKKNVIWTNKVWTAVYFKRNIKGLRNSQLNFPTKSFFVSISLQAVIPTWKAAARSASSCHSPWRTGRPVRRCHDPPPPRSRQVYPPTSGWCQLHSLDPIAVLLLTLWAATHNCRSSCRCGADESPWSSRRSFIKQVTFTPTPPSPHHSPLTGVEVSKCDQSGRTSAPVEVSSSSGSQCGRWHLYKIY